METDPSFDVPDAAWRQAAEGIPVSDIFDLADGTSWRLAMTGIWSIGKRRYEYSSVDVAGYTLAQAQQLGLVKRLVTAGPGDVEQYRVEADSTWDREFLGLTRTTGKRSNLVVWAVSADVPIQLRFGEMYRSSTGTRHGTKEAWFAPKGVTTAPQYRRAAVEYRAAHGLPDPLPRESAPASDKQLQVLRRALAGRSGYMGTLALPYTATAASEIVSALAQANWKLTPAVRDIWTAAIRREAPRRPASA